MIQKEGANRFVFRDRGTNGGTTESRMFIVGKGGPEVVIGSFTTDLGSFQKWTGNNKPDLESNTIPRVVLRFNLTHHIH